MSTNKIIIIGSKAMQLSFPDFKRDPKDLDVVVCKKSIDLGRFTKSDYIKEINKRVNKRVEFLENEVLLNFLKNYSEYVVIDPYLGPYLHPSALYTLKMSHMFWDINWEKHAYDIQFLKDKNVKPIKELFYALYDQWQIVHGNNKRSDLKMSALDFFNNAVKCPYSHDWLHTLIKDPPTYTKILCDGAEVEVCEQKFNNLTFEEKCNLVQEEIYVMAWERMPKKLYHHSYYTMFKKFIISHAPIWEAFFILDNFSLLCKPKINFKKILEDGINQSRSFNGFV